MNEDSRRVDTHTLSHQGNDHADSDRGNFELRNILESELQNLSLTAKMRRSEALARQGVLSKLVLPVIKALNDKRTREAAKACLKQTATLLKREPEADLGFDFKKWTTWYDDAKKGTALSSAKDDKLDKSKTEQTKN